MKKLTDDKKALIGTVIKYGIFLAGCYVGGQMFGDKMSQQIETINDNRVDELGVTDEEA